MSQADGSVVGEGVTLRGGGSRLKWYGLVRRHVSKSPLVFAMANPIVSEV